MRKIARLGRGQRLPRAIYYRDMAVEILAHEGDLDVFANIVPRLSFARLQFTLSLYAPFPTSYGLERRVDLSPDMFTMQSCVDRDHFLQIHVREKKVLSMQWDYPQHLDVDLITFIRGDWEMCLCEHYGCERYEHDFYSPPIWI